jgi:hypothetical protein
LGVSLHIEATVDAQIGLHTAGAWHGSISQRADHTRLKTTAHCHWPNDLPIGDVYPLTPFLTLENADVMKLFPHHALALPAAGATRLKIIFWSLRPRVLGADAAPAAKAYESRPC